MDFQCSAQPVLSKPSERRCTGIAAEKQSPYLRGVSDPIERRWKIAPVASMRQPKRGPGGRKSGAPGWSYTQSFRL